jgi:hypothetical protein
MIIASNYDVTYGYITIHLRFSYIYTCTDTTKSDVIYGAGYLNDDTFYFYSGSATTFGSLEGNN